VIFHLEADEELRWPKVKKNIPDINNSGFY
jgi:hypothetical protein